MRPRLLPIWIALMLAAGPGFAQNPPGAAIMQAPDPVLHLSLGAQDLVLWPRDIARIDISESGGITDLFIWLEGGAAKTLSLATGAAQGAPMIARVCGEVIGQGGVQSTTATGTIYLPNTTAQRAEALRALWHGRARCDTVGPEVFSNGN